MAAKTTTTTTNIGTGNIGLYNAYRNEMPQAVGVRHMFNRTDNYNAHLFEPMRTNNFELQIFGLGQIRSSTDNRLSGGWAKNNSFTSTAGGKSGAMDKGVALTLSTSSFTAPSLDVQQVSVSYGNGKINYAGTPNWGTSSIEFNDFVGLQIEEILTGWWKQAYNPDTELIGWATQYKKTALLLEFDVAGECLQKWKLDGLWLKTLNLGTFNQEGGNTTRKISGTLVYDRAVPLVTYAEIGKWDNTKSVRERDLQNNLVAL